jgi:RNA polymerase sigma-70 factor (sigma-E family)
MRAETEVGIRAVGGLERLYSDHIGSAVRLAYLMTGDQEQARDIAQDAFVKVAGRFHGLRNPDAFPSYLRMTVINLSRGHFRKLKTQRDYLSRQASGEATSPGPDLGGRDEMWRALQTLPDRQRAALVLRYYEDLSEQQIADALGSSKSAAKSLLSRGLQQLRDQMRGEA